MSMTYRMMAAALAAALALPAVAETKSEVEERYRKATGQRAGEAKPAPAPAPAAQGQAQATGQQAQGQIVGDQRTALGTMWSRHALAIRAGELGATRGSPEIQSLARKQLDEHQRAQKDLAAYVAQRGGDVNALPPAPDAQRIEAEIAQLGTKSGEEFDRDFVAFLTKNHATFVEDMKRARDTTAGKDPVFKKWLDDVENVEEEHLSAARQLKSQRQARTPPRR
jgi:putative membrane protein